MPCLPTTAMSVTGAAGFQPRPSPHESWNIQCEYAKGVPESSLPGLTRSALSFIFPFETAALNADNITFLIFETEIGIFMKLLTDGPAFCVC